MGKAGEWGGALGPPMPSLSTCRGQGGQVRGGSLLSISEPLVIAPPCRAAEAVLQGRAESILTYHQQNVPRAKLDQVSVIPCLALR